MKFVLTPEEAQKPARAVAAYLRRQGMIVKAEATAWADAPYRTTLLARKAGLNALIEVQDAPDYTSSIKNLAVWLAATKLYVELYLATKLRRMVLACSSWKRMGMYPFHEKREILLW